MRSAPPIELHSQAILAVVGLAERVAEWMGLVLTPGDAECLSDGTLLSRSSTHRRSVWCPEHCLIVHRVSCCRFFWRCGRKEEYMRNAACACPSEIYGDFRRTRSSQEYCALHRNPFIPIVHNALVKMGPFCHFVLNTRTTALFISI